MDSRATPDERRFTIGLLFRRLIVSIVPLLVIAGGIAAFMGMGAIKPVPEEKEETIKAAPVLVAEAASDDVRLSVMTQGEVTPRTSIRLVPQVSGKIIEVSRSFIEGGAFAKNDILLRIDPEEYRLRVVQAEATVAQMWTRLRNEEAEAEVARAEVDDLGLERETSMLAMREPQLAEARANVASAQAALEEAKLQLERTKIRAPFDGRVRTKDVDIGQFVSVGMELGEVFSVDLMEVPLPLTDNELGQLGLSVGFMETEEAPGPVVMLSSIVAGEPHDWSGRIVRTDSGYDPQTRVLFAYAEVEDPYGAGADRGTPMASGLFVTAQIEGKMLRNSIVVPRTALRGKDEVYVVRNDTEIEIRKVNVASSDRDRVVITAGLEVGEKVVTSPIRGAADGMKVEVVDPAAAEDTESEVSEESDDPEADGESVSVAQSSAN